MITNHTNKNEIYVECIEKTKNNVVNIPAKSQIRLAFVRKGSCFISFAKNLYVPLEVGNVILIPPHNKCLINVTNSIQLIIFYLTVDLNLCNSLPLETLTEVERKINNTSRESGSIVLKANAIISDYFKQIKHCLMEKIKSAEFFQMKQNELLYYFGNFYTKEALYYFFKPVLTNDIAFSKACYALSEKACSINDMAKELDYSLSGFKKRFKDVFGIPVYRWLCQEKSKKLFHEITCGNKTLTQLSHEFHFSSPAHLTNFCTKIFGKTPSTLRGRRKKTSVSVNNLLLG
ncbi:MAG: helix-turn-helix domain-containing protein [Prevotellaceae bacterium]|jgi:AraC-like DNA-binding protein|nr:helix-turn-helix domain-containing protein [Prevotellaceae bacterium]